MQIIFTAVGQRGCTFLDWSFHYLAGYNQYWSIPKSGWQLLPANPLQQIQSNAHLHRRNHPTGLVACEEWLDRAQQYTEPKDISFYCCFDDRVTFQAQNGTARYAETLQRCMDRGARVVLVESDLPLPGIPNRDNTRYDPDTLCNELRIKFPDRDRLPDTDPGRLREYMAFNMHYLRLRDWECRTPEELQTLAQHTGFYRLNFHNWIFSGEQAIQQIMHHLDRPIDSDRWQQWQTIYAQWNNFWKPDLQWAQDLDGIARAVCSAESVDLEPYRMNLVKEAELLYVLMHQHGCGLRHRSHSQLPTNTRDLHQLLSNRS